MNETEKKLLELLRSKGDELTDDEKTLKASLEAKEKEEKKKAEGASPEDLAKKILEGIQGSKTQVSADDIAAKVAEALAKEKEEKDKGDEVAKLQKEIANLKKAATGVHFDTDSKRVEVGDNIKQAEIEAILEHEPYTDDEKKIHKMNDEMYTGSVLKKMVAKNSGREMSQIQAVNEIRKHPYFQNFHGFAQANPVGKAMATASGYEGEDWVPTGYSADLIEKVRLETKIAQLFDKYTMSDNTEIFPIESTDADMYYISENTGDDDEITAANKIPAATPATGNRTMTARKGGVRVVLSEDLKEDSIVKVVPWINKHLITKFAEGLESAVINGDRSGTHMDSNVTAATDRRKMFVGLRFTADGNYEYSLSTFNYDSVMKIPEQMGVYGASYDQLFWIVGTKLRHRLGYIRDAQNNNVVLTLDKYGPNATVLKGEIGKLANIPIILSGQLPENLNATGVYDGSTTSKGIMLLVYRPGFVLGERRALKIKTAEIIDTDQIKVVATMRKAFFHRYNDSIVAQGYNIDLS